LFGYDTGIISGAQLYFKDTWPEITNEEIELVVSLAQFGAFIGSLIAGPISDKVGRKIVIILADILFSLGAVFMMTASSIQALMIGRVIVGLGVGIASLVVPVYLSEVSPIEVRGTVVAVDIVLVTIGQFLASIISLMLATNWRLMLGLAGIPSAIQLLIMLFMPES
jgi:SP family myo-inositol transporter-like MFS transporter 13